MCDKPTKNQINTVFNALLGRSPESKSVYEAFLGLTNIDEVIAAVKLSDEYNAIARPNPLYNYASQIDAIQIIRSHEDTRRVAVPGRLVNFLGVAIDPEFLPNILTGKGGTVEGVPIPANWHADIAEFAAALRAVDLADQEFRVLELGCGWGCWLLNTGVAARNRGLRVELIGVEADAGHVEFARCACSENGFSEENYTIHRGVVGPKSGNALFPKQEVAGLSWGLEPIFDPSEEVLAQAGKMGKYDVLPVITIEMVAKAGKRIDLLHIDIQGGEAKFIDACMSQLTKFVAYVVIGTHSRSIEGNIIDRMLENGWILEIERPAIIGFSKNMLPYTQIDGVQGWRNPRLVQ